MRICYEEVSLGGPGQVAHRGALSLIHEVLGLFVLDFVEDALQEALEVVAAHDGLGELGEAALRGGAHLGTGVAEVGRQKADQLIIFLEEEQVVAQDAHQL